MLDFTSALYLGLRHPSAALTPWPALSSGRPAALAEHRGAEDVAASLAGLAGCVVSSCSWAKQGGAASMATTADAARA